MAILTILLGLTLQHFEFGVRTTVIAILVTTVIASAIKELFVDEYLEVGVSDWYDVLANFIGMAIGYSLLLLYWA